MERILVIGGTGLVGNALVRAWAACGHAVAAATYHCHPSEAFRQLDMQDERAVAELLEELRPGVVAIPAANPFVDHCEKNPAETRRLNVDGTLAAARRATALGARVIFFSSDYVFDGRKGLYKESDPVSPLSEYGRQKAEVEERLLALSPRHLVARTAGAFGWQWEPKNFVLQVKSRLERRERMKVVADVRYAPTYVEELASCVVELAARGEGGIFHAVGDETIGRFEFAEAVAAAWSLDAGLLERARSSDFPSAAPRPKESSLDISKLRKALGRTPCGAREGLRRMRAFEAEWRRYAASLPSASSV